MKSIKLSLSSYGPFESLELELTPITLLVGPNVVGKSFLLRAIYAMLTPCYRGALDIGTLISRLCNNSICNETVCLNRVLRRGSQTLEIKLDSGDFRRSLKYDAKANKLEAEADCPPVKSIFIPGCRVYLVPYAYNPLGKIPELGFKEFLGKYVDVMEGELRDLLGKTPEVIRGQVEELVEVVVKTVKEVKDLETYVKAFMKIIEVLDKFTSILSREGVEVSDIRRARNDIEESLNALISLYINPPVFDMIALLEPIVHRLKTELEIGEPYGVRPEEVVDNVGRVIKELFPEVKYLDISLPGISEVSSDIPLLPTSILHSYSLITSFVYAEKLAEKGVRVVLLIEEPELGLDFKRQRMLAEYIVSTVKRAKGMLSVVISTHSAEMLVSLTKEVVKKRMRKYSRVCEVYDGKVRCRQVDRSGRVYVEYMFEELGEIYSGL
ncbi:MAG: ATP-binding protein [Desulfurococcaceae archaeon]|nr:ATP-binding protein [Desulfurococcaceae archaeon]